MGLFDLLGSVFSSGDSAREAADVQNQYAQQGMNALNKQYNQSQGYQQPYYDVGTQGMKSLAEMAGNGGFNVTPYNYNQTYQPGNMPQQYQDQGFNFQADPGYQWQLQQGNNAVQGNAAAGGMQLSGTTQKALQRYGQGLANQTYGQAFNRNTNQRDYGANQAQAGIQNWQNQNLFNLANLQGNRANEFNMYQAQNQQTGNQYNRMSDIAGVGQGAANYMSQLSQNYGNFLSDLYGSMGANQAAGIMGQQAQQQQGLNTAIGLGGLGTSLAGLFSGGWGATQTPYQKASSMIKKTYGV